MGYAEAKAKDKNLDSYIKNRAAAKKSGDKSAQNAAQNKINKAYGKGPTNRPVTPKVEKPVIVKKEPKVEKPVVVKKEEKVVVKEETAMDKAKKAIESGDKTAAKESGLKGGLKRQAKRSAGKKDREMARDDKKANKAEGRADKEAEKTAKKESIKAAGSRKAARLTQKSDAAKSNEKNEIDKYYADPKNKTVRGKDKEKAQSDIRKAEDETDKKSKKLKNEKTKLTKKADKETLKTAGAPTTFKSFDQMDSQDAMATAGESPTEMSGGPIKYFKGKINYDIKEASNSNLSQSARNNYAKNAQHDMKSMAPMTMGKAPMTMGKAPIGQKPAKRKGGSIISKHMNS
jgi:hypothetical protein